MSYLTLSKLNNVIDHGICLPSTEVRQGDWLILASVKIVQPMKLRYRFLNLNLISSAVNISDITSLNKISGNLGLIYVALRLNYVSGSPGESGGLDLLKADALGVVSRPTSEIIFTAPGTYSWLLANNCKSSSSSVIPATTSIDFVTSVNGALRIELE